MKILASLFLFLAFGLHLSFGYNAGDSADALIKEIGRPESTLERGYKKVFIYEDGSRFVFINDSLVSLNGKNLISTASVTTPWKDDQTAESKSDQTQQPEDSVGLDDPVTADANSLQETADDLDFDYSYEYTDDYSEPTAKERALKIFLIFIVEWIITLTVLKITFQLTGFPCIWRQLIVLSSVVAFSGLIVNVLIPEEMASTVRASVGFIVLLLTIRKFTDVREWATAIKIAITARVVSFLLEIVIVGGLFLLFINFIF
ncbi:MAG: hypothetical protein ACSHYA_08180 [Opitutaceae bacterium]